MHLSITSKLDDERALLLKNFLLRHNMVLTYNKDSGFEVRDDDVITKLKPAVIMVLDRDESGEFYIKSKRLAEEELDRMQMNGDLSELERIVREKIN